MSVAFFGKIIVVSGVASLFLASFRSDLPAAAWRYVRGLTEAVYNALVWAAFLVGCERQLLGRVNHSRSRGGRL